MIFVYFLKMPGAPSHLKINGTTPISSFLDASNNLFLERKISFLKAATCWFSLVRYEISVLNLHTGADLLSQIINLDTLKYLSNLLL